MMPFFGAIGTPAPVKYTATITGAPLEGQTTATSLAVPCSPVPVLSPTRQSFGRPARNRASPVLLAINQAVICSREAAESAVASKRSVFRLEAIALGVVVSRGSSDSA